MNQWETNTDVKTGLLFPKMMQYVCKSIRYYIAVCLARDKTKHLLLQLPHIIVGHYLCKVRQSRCQIFLNGNIIIVDNSSFYKINKVY